ncbi:MAG: PRC-barrel domain-containing protein [Kofleriaceae bacterium]
MLRALSELNGYQIEATDGVIGHVTGCYFDDDTWTVAGLVVNTGGWLARREVLLSSELLGSLYWQTATLAARLTRREVEECSSLSLDEERHPHLRSSREVFGYHLQALDDVLGHVEDFILDTERWVIRYVAVDTSSWWFGGHALISPRWLGAVRLRERILELNLTRDALKNVPRWMPGGSITPEYEASLLEYDRLREAWSKSPQATEAALAPRPLHRSPAEAP